MASMSRTNGGGTLVPHFAGLKPRLQNEDILNMYSIGGRTSVLHKKDRLIPHNARLKPCLQLWRREFIRARKAIR